VPDWRDRVTAVQDIAVIKADAVVVPSNRRSTLSLTSEPMHAARLGSAKKRSPSYCVKLILHQEEHPACSKVPKLSLLCAVFVVPAARSFALLVPVSFIYMFDMNILNIQLVTLMLQLIVSGTLQIYPVFTG